MTNGIRLDRERTEHLAATFGVAIRNHYLNNKQDAALVLEVINALAMAAASVLGGVEQHHVTAKLWDFLNDCIETNIVEIQTIQANARKARSQFDA